VYLKYFVRELVGHMKQTKSMHFKDIFREKKVDSKQFKMATGSPILYTKISKHKSIYYPSAKRKAIKRQKPQRSHRHAAVVNSETYGREVYGNIDIWPDEEIARETLHEKLRRSSLSKSYDTGITFELYKAQINLIKVKGIYQR
jgi:hypothetical protein